MLLFHDQRRTLELVSSQCLLKALSHSPPFLVQSHAPIRAFGPYLEIESFHELIMLGWGNQLEQSDGSQVYRLIDKLEEVARNREVPHRPVLDHASHLTVHASSVMVPATSV